MQFRWDKGKPLFWEDAVLHSQTFPIKTFGALRGNMVISPLISNYETIQTSTSP